MKSMFDYDTCKWADYAMDSLSVSMDRYSVKFMFNHNKICCEVNVK